MRNNRKLSELLPYLYRSFQRALLFNIPSKVKLIFFSTESSDLDIEVTMYVISNQNLTDDEKDFLFAASEEVEGDFEEINNCKVVFIVSNNEFKYDKKYGNLIFALAEQ